LVPAVIYGRAGDSVSVALDIAAYRKFTVGAGSQVHRVAVDGIRGESNVLVQEIKVDSLTGRPLHMDLRRISMTEVLRSEVPLVAQGEEELEKKGLILQWIQRVVVIESLPADIPGAIAVDVSRLEHGEQIAARDLELPPHVKMLSHEDDIIVSVIAPKAVEVEAEEETEEPEAEPEV